MLNEALRLIRVFHDLKQGDAADKLEISASYLSEIESGRKKPTLDLIDKYADVFDIPASSILFFSEHMDKPDRREQARVTVANKILKLMKFIEAR